VHIKIIILSEGTKRLLSVSLDFRNGNGPQVYLNQVDITAAAGAPPAHLRVGFAASTGAATNIHEVRNLRVTLAGTDRSKP
jgi:hypothetical protein